jgi:hypothetical protein
MRQRVDECGHVSPNTHLAQTVWQDLARGKIFTTGMKRSTQVETHSGKAMLLYSVNSEIQIDAVLKQPLAITPL